MTNPKHTPWPWKLLVGGGFNIFSSDLKKIAVVEKREDANLFMAAPELLVEVKKSLKHFEEWNGYGNHTADIERLQALIKKASE